MDDTQPADLHLSRDGHVAMIETDRSPNNHISLSLVIALAEMLERLDADPGCRAVFTGA